jgi:uncharacterized membrane protein
MWGLSTFLNRLSVERIPAVLLQAIVGITYIMFIPIALKLCNVSNPFTYKWSFYSVCLTCLATICSILANIMLYMTLKGSNTTGASTMLISLYPVVTLILSVIFLHEQFTLPKTIGVVLMIIGAIFLGIK